MASILSDTSSTRSHPLISFLGVLNCCALDAPAVAIAWQLALPRTASNHAQPSPWVSLSLGLTVWLIYMADRLLDGCRIDTKRSLASRHAFSNRYATPLFIIWVSVLLLDLVVLTLLPVEIIRNELLLVPLMAGYLIVVHASPTLSHRFPKELCVGPIFAAGIVLTKPEFMPLVETLCTFAMLSTLCVANCLIVSYAQRESDLEQGMANGWELVPVAGRAMNCFCWMAPVGVASLCLAGLIDIYQSLALGASACLLIILWQRMQRTPDADEQFTVSLLADYALSIPAIIMFITTLWH